jgi:hypothetical protein
MKGCASGLAHVPVCLECYGAIDNDEEKYQTEEGKKQLSG